MAEEIVVLTGPNGQTFKCVKSQLMKHPGEDPWGRPYHPVVAKNYNLN